MNFIENISLKQYNTFGIDIIASGFIELEDPGEVEDLIQKGIFSEGRYLILGGGSNILFINDFNGWVIRNMIMGLEVEEINLDIGDLGITRFNKKELDKNICKCKRLWPHKTNTQGFFISKLRKI